MMVLCVELSRSLFQPTHPLRGATEGHVHHGGHGGISIHAPLAGRDLMAYAVFKVFFAFQPTHPIRMQVTPEGREDSLTVTV